MTHFNLAINPEDRRKGVYVEFGFEGGMDLLWKQGVRHFRVRFLGVTFYYRRCDTRQFPEHVVC